MGRLSHRFTGHRDPNRIEHSVDALIKQRALGLCLAYEDLNAQEKKDSGYPFLGSAPVINALGEYPLIFWGNSC